jgi:ribosomal protein S18 acetylase RimI-like enzyme
VPGTFDTPELIFRAENYGAMVAAQLAADARAAAAELPGHPDLIPPVGAELEPSDRGVFVVGYLNEQPVVHGGYRRYALDPDEDTVELVRLYVRRQTRRTGLGRALLVELEERALDDEYRRAVLHIGVQQAGAQAMFQLLGYRRLPGEPDDWGRVRYGKDLPEG